MEIASPGREQFVQLRRAWLEPARFVPDDVAVVQVRVHFDLGQRIIHHPVKNHELDSAELKNGVVVPVVDDFNGVRATVSQVPGPEHDAVAALRHQAEVGELAHQPGRRPRSLHVAVFVRPISEDKKRSDFGF